MPPEEVRLAESAERRIRRDRIFLNNPVIVQGLGLAPLIVAATTLQNAALLGLMVLLMLTPVRMLAALLGKVTHVRFRGLLYAVISGVVYGVMLFLVGFVLPSYLFVPLGLYLPLLVVDPIILKRYERAQNERVGTALRKGVVISLGYALVLVLIGALRELLGAGALGGVVLLHTAPFPMAQLPSGGFLVLALVMALWRSAVRVLRNNMEPALPEEGEEKV